MLALPDSSGSRDCQFASVETYISPMAATLHPPSSVLFLGKCQGTAEEMNALISWKGVFSSGSQQVNGWAGNRNELSCAQSCPFTAISVLYLNKRTNQPPGRVCGWSFA